MGALGVEESTRWRLKGSSGVGLGEAAMDVRGLIGGVLSPARRRAELLKLKFLLKMSLDRGCQPTNDDHVSLSFVALLGFGDADEVAIVTAFGAFGALSFCGMSS